MIVIVVILWAVQIWVGYLIGKRKGRPVLGLVLGLLLGIIGWAIMALIPRTHEKQVQDAGRQQSLQLEAMQRAQYPPQQYLPPQQYPPQWTAGQTYPQGTFPLSSAPKQEPDEPDWTELKPGRPSPQ